MYSSYHSIPTVVIFIIRFRQELLLLFDSEQVQFLIRFRWVLFALFDFERYYFLFYSAGLIIFTYNLISTDITLTIRFREVNKLNF